MRFQAVSRAHQRFIEHPEIPLVTAILAALLIRLIMTIGSNGILWPDSAAYYRSAALMAKYGNFHWHEIYRTPLYPAFMAMFLWSFGQSVFAGALIVGAQRLLGILSTLILYRIARRSFGPAAAFYGSLLFAGHTLQLYYETTIHTEALFTFLLLLVVYYSSTMLNTAETKYAALVGLFCGLATLARPIAQFVLLMILAMLFLKQGCSRQTFKSALVSIFIFAGILAPWMATNKAYYGFFGVSQDLGLNLFHRLIDVERIPPVNDTAYPRVLRVWNAVKDRQRISYFHVYHTLLRERVRKVKADRMMAGFALESLQQDSWQYLPQYGWNSLRTFFQFFFDVRNSPQFCGAERGPYLCTRNTLGRSERAFTNDDTGLSHYPRKLVKRYFDWMTLPMAVVSGLALAGFGLLLRDLRSIEPSTLLMLALIMYFALLTGIFNVPEDRFRLPIDGFLIAAAVFTLSKLVEYSRCHGTAAKIESSSTS